MRSKQRKDIDSRFLRAYRLLYADEKVSYKKDFCEAVGLLPQNLSMMERGTLSCTVDNIYRLATNYGVSLNWLFFGEGDFYGHPAV
ncbi:MAG: helix-turn-helix transcriptional regulator [Paludibacteraceae bacterium]|nr:helix-turn-helix transcriptional regulator [Paludibacteraceae bacterium]